jgi:hypothetical protein
MGDARRHRMFAAFINRTYPSIESVLIVAGGKGRIARLLANKGVRVRVIEADPRYSGQSEPLITYEEGWFDRNTEVPEELIIGMHPDHATAEIIFAANQHRIPFAVVPCCVCGPEAEGVSGVRGWLDRLKGFAGDCCEEELDMKGKNVVLYRRGE